MPQPLLGEISNSSILTALSELVGMSLSSRRCVSCSVWNSIGPDKGKTYSPPPRHGKAKEPGQRVRNQTQQGSTSGTNASAVIALGSKGTFPDYHTTFEPQRARRAAITRCLQQVLHNQKCKMYLRHFRCSPWRLASTEQAKRNSPVSSLFRWNDVTCSPRWRSKEQYTLHARPANMWWNHITAVSPAADCSKQGNNHEISPLTSLPLMYGLTSSGTCSLFSFLTMSSDGGGGL